MTLAMTEAHPTSPAGVSRRLWLGRLGAAAAVVATAPLSAQTSAARAAGPPPAPPPSPAAVRDWEMARRIPVLDISGLPGAHELRYPALTLLRAAGTGAAAEVRCHGGENPGAARRILPRFLFLVEGYDALYCDAYCLTRRATRTFCLDRLTPA